MTFITFFFYSFKIVKPIQLIYNNYLMEWNADRIKDNTAQHFINRCTLKKTMRAIRTLDLIGLSLPLFCSHTLSSLLSWVGCGKVMKHWTSIPRLGRAFNPTTFMTQVACSLIEKHSNSIIPPFFHLQLKGLHASSSLFLYRNKQ